MTHMLLASLIFAAMPAHADSQDLKAAYPGCTFPANTLSRPELIDQLAQAILKNASLESADALKKMSDPSSRNPNRVGPVCPTGKGVALRPQGIGVTWGASFVVVVPHDKIVAPLMLNPEDSKRREDADKKEFSTGHTLEYMHEPTKAGRLEETYNNHEIHAAMLMAWDLLNRPDEHGSSYLQQLRSETKP